MVLLFPFQWHHDYQTDRKDLPQVYPEDVVMFFSNLTNGLEGLEKSFRSEKLSLSFMHLALDFLRSTHAGVVQVAEKLRLPAFCKTGEWLNEYMDETVKLLDVCNVLKSGLSDLEHYQMLVDSVVRAVESRRYLVRGQRNHLHALEASKQELSRIENDHKLLLEQKIEAEGKLTVHHLSDKHFENKFVKWNGFWGVLSTVKVINSYICRLLLSTVVYAWPHSMLDCQAVNVRAQWAKALKRLQQGVNDEILQSGNSRRCTFILSNEVDVLVTILEDLRSGPLGYPGQPRITALKKALLKFQTDLEAFDWHVNDLFDEVVVGRNKLLNLTSRS